MANNFVTPSDARLKEQVREIPDALERGVYFTR